MSEPGRFSLEKLAEELPLRPATFLAGFLALLAALILSRDDISEIPEMVEAKFGYDSQLRATLKNRSIATAGLPVTFVAVDDAALNEWSDATRTTPRTKIAELIAGIAGKGPSLIFVDFDLAGTSTNGGDVRLNDVLEKYAKDAPPLLVTRSLAPMECPEDGCGPQACSGGGTAGAAASSPFESAISGKENIHWVSSVVNPDGDGVVRRWRLWELQCRNAALSVLPSPQLVAAALVGPKAPGRGKLDAYLQALGDQHNARDARLEWPENAGARDALIPFLIGGASQLQVSDWMSKDGFRYERVRATSVLADQVADTAFKDRVVVLGASYGSDKLKTPLGIMAGAALLANAIAVAPSIINERPNHPISRMLLTLMLAILYGTIAKTLRAIPAAVVIATVSYVWLSLATFWLNPADAVDTVSLALVILGAFLAMEAAIEIALDLIKGEGLAAIMRKKSSGH